MQYGKGYWLEVMAYGGVGPMSCQKARASVPCIYAIAIKTTTGLPLIWRKLKSRIFFLLNCSKAKYMCLKKLKAYRHITGIIFSWLQIFLNKLLGNLCKEMLEKAKLQKLVENTSKFFWQKLPESQIFTEYWISCSFKYFSSQTFRGGGNVAWRS